MCGLVCDACVWGWMKYRGVGARVGCVSVCVFLVIRVHVWPRSRTWARLKKRSGLAVPPCAS